MQPDRLSRGQHLPGDSSLGQVTRDWQVIGLSLATFQTPNRRERLLLVLSGLFVLVGTDLLSLVELDHWSAVHWSLVGVWGLCFGAAHLVLCRHAPKRDPLLLPLAGLLAGWGLLLIARLADVSFLLRQCVWLALSTATFLLIVARSQRLRWLRRYRYTWLLSGLALLAVTLVLGTNPSGFGPRLWLGGRVPGLGRAFIQPSEILKLLMVAYLSSYLAEKRELVLGGPRVGWSMRRLGWLRERPSASAEGEKGTDGSSRRASLSLQLPSWPYLAPLLVMWGLAMVLLAWQQDLGAALLFYFTFLVMLYQASDSWGYVLAGLVLFVIASIGAYALLDTVALRVDIWLNPWADPGGRAFQVVQSLIAFASGGLFGQGLGQGSPTYIPAIHTDFPFAAIAEEFGLLGIIGLIAAVAVLTLRGLYIALNARTLFRRLLAAGLATLLGLQAWIIMAGTSKLIPLTGVTLPFVSYGGSSLLSSFVVLGLLTVVSRDEGVGGRAGYGVRPTHAKSDARSQVQHMSGAFLLAFAALALVSGYWAVIRQDPLWTRDDNPRLVEAEQRLQRGPIFDRDEVILARSKPDENGLQARLYLTPTMPAVGYYSLQYGVGGIEASADRLLRGLDGRSEADLFFDQLLHRQPAGRGIALTLDARLHKEIVTLLEKAGETAAATDEGEWMGAMALLDADSGAVLALVSQPIYDPNRLDTDWEGLESDPAAPLLNRATQGLYQPGGALQPVILAAALEAGIAGLDDVFTDLTVTVPLDGRQLGCAGELAGRTLADAVAAACPQPVAELGEMLGERALEQTFRAWRLDTPPTLEVGTVAGQGDVTDPRLAAIGQEALTVTPLHMALVAAALGNEGRMPSPYLVLRTEVEGGRWQTWDPPGQSVQVLDGDLARRVRQSLRQSLEGQVLGHASLALAGTDRPLHAWFLGLAPAQNPRYAVAVLSEHGGVEGLPLARQIGEAALLAALDQDR